MMCREMKRCPGRGGSGAPGNAQMNIMEEAGRFPFSQTPWDPSGAASAPFAGPADRPENGVAAKFGAPDPGLVASFAAIEELTRRRRRVEEAVAGYLQGWISQAV